MNLKREIIEEIINRRITTAPDSFKTTFPDVIKNRVRWDLLVLGNVLMVAFFDSTEEKRLHFCAENGYNFYPGLISAETSPNVMFRLENTNNAFYRSCSANNVASFSVGKNSTFVIQDHEQTISTEEQGEITYKIPLAYGVSVTDETTETYFYQSLDALIAFSIRVWRGEN